ncbi:MAG: TIGR04283 family arsenosugar biosynthesis glycosyltransferase [Proteobacteria bacterium]|nr:TIGR04283 family arsenosugar biosynthesis glycosyltransferase [Pseudomonadota bacterium]
MATNPPASQNQAEVWIGEFRIRSCPTVPWTRTEVKNIKGTCVAVCAFRSHDETVLAALSVVIPTLNAATMLRATLACLGEVGEVIVADGGSTDATCEVAAACGVAVIEAQQGRGVQLAAGISAARHDWLLLLHADTRLAPGWRSAAAAHMHDPGRAAYFRFALDASHWKARALRRAVALRCRLLALPYGDQGLLIHCDLLDAAGGMRPLPLMEDIDLVRRLGRCRLAALPVEAATSAIRWERQGWFRRSARNLACLMLYFVGVPPAAILRIYG